MATIQRRDPWVENVDIISAENVNFAVETAGLGSRFGAALIDLSVQILLILLVSLLSSYLIDLLPDLGDFAKLVKNCLYALFGLVMALILLGYSFFLEWLWNGQTLGKRWLGLRVLQNGGTPVTAWDCMVRSLFRIADFLPFGYGVGTVVVLLSAHNRRIGDLVAGTIVARERHDASRRHIMDIDAAATAFLDACAGRVTEDMGNDTGESTRTNTAMTMADFLGESDSELVREFFERRKELLPEPRKKLAFALASRLSNKLGQPMPEAVHAERWLEELAKLLFVSAP